MKNKIVIGILIISLSVNIFFFGKWLIFEKWYIPTKEEEIILSEMIKNTIESDDYKNIKEDIIAINSTVDRNKGGVFPYYLNINVITDKQTYIFSCKDEECKTMKNDSWGLSIYTEENPRLPFKN